jgi:hypothetical protein
MLLPTLYEPMSVTIPRFDKVSGGIMMAIIQFYLVVSRKKFDALNMLLLVRYFQWPVL